MLPRTIQAAGSRVLHWFVVTLRRWLVTRVTDGRWFQFQYQSPRDSTTDNSMHCKFRAFCSDVSEIQMLFSIPTRAVVATLTDVTRAMAFGQAVTKGDQ